MLPHFVYITAKKLRNNRIDYSVRTRNTPEEYFEDLEDSEQVGYKLVRSFTVDMGGLPRVLQTCDSFANGRLSLDDLDSQIEDIPGAKKILIEE